MCGSSLGPKCLLLVLHLLSSSIEPSWSSCSAPGPVKDGTVSLMPQHRRREDGRVPEAAQAKVECTAGYGLIYPEYETQVCEGGKWTNSVNPDGSICVPLRCGPPPKIEHGYFTVEKTKFKSTDRAGDTFPFGTTVEPACEENFYLNCQHQCGRIICDADGTWKSRDLKSVTECVPAPLRSNLSNSDDGGNGVHTPSLKHYLMIVLAVICVLIVVAVGVLLLRRPSACKKQSGRSSHVNNMQHCGDNPVIITSSSPVPGALDLPVAMNTGIFVPGGSYDWQECRFQEATLVGTQVFK